MSMTTSALPSTLVSAAPSAWAQRPHVISATWKVTIAFSFKVTEVIVNLATVGESSSSPDERITFLLSAAVRKASAVEKHVLFFLLPQVASLTRRAYERIGSARSRAAPDGNRSGRINAAMSGQLTFRLLLEQLVTSS
jgi:hypothetical protein